MPVQRNEDFSNLQEHNRHEEDPSPEELELD